MLVRRIAVSVAVVAIVAAHGAGAQGDAAAEEPKRVQVRFPASNVPPSPDQPLSPYLKREAPHEEDDKSDWPTDDFGKPLRGCDVPWDFVPPKR